MRGDAGSLGVARRRPGRAGSRPPVTRRRARGDPGTRGRAARGVRSRGPVRADEARARRPGAWRGAGRAAPGPAAAGPGGYAAPGGRCGGVRGRGRGAAGHADAAPRAGAGPGPACGAAVPVRPGPGLPGAPVRPGGGGLDRRRARRAGPRPAECPACPGGGPGRRWPRRRGRGSASTQTKSGPACTRGPGGAASSGTESGLRAALPLSWLARVWAPGFPVADGHLVVDVLEVSWPQVRVLGLQAPGAEPAVLSIQPDGEHWSRAARER